MVQAREHGIRPGEEHRKVGGLALEFLTMSMKSLLGGAQE
jgi:hypothetical protein